VRACIDVELWLARQSDYWDLAGRHLKTARVLDVREVQGVWTPHRIEVRNHRSGHTTIFEFSEIDYRTPLGDELFTESALRQGLR
jgi:hypothetical protein